VREGLPVDEMVFGRYRLLSVIGQGGMGTVYKAHDTVIDRDVAIKVLPPELGAEPGYRQRFRREAHTAARLTEPHIIPIHDTGEIDGQLYLVMPIIDGIDVHGLLARDGPMSPQRAVRFVEQLAAALDAAHAVGLVHRDVKPSNALVTGNDFVYLIDFGIAHDTSATKLTSTGMIVGTFAYMAPERFTDGVADARSDIYALACVLHECLIGDPPYPGDSMEQQIVGHLTLKPPPPSAHRPDVPVGFDEVIARGMAKDPDQRYQTAHELASAAHQALTTTPIRTPRTTPTPVGDPTRPVAAPTLVADQVGPPPESVWQRGAHPNPAATRQHHPPGWAPVPQPPPAQWSPPAPVAMTPQPRRRAALIAAIAATVVMILAAGTIGIAVFLQRSRPRASQTPTAPSAAPSSPISSAPQVSSAPQATAPATATALDGLLLTPDQINTAMGATGMTSVGTMTTMPDSSSFVSDAACLPLAAAVQAKVYASSGWSDMRAQMVAKSQQSAVTQAAVSFPSPQGAASFFTASTQSWQACSNRQFTLAMNGNSQVHTVGPVSDTNGTLSATITPANSFGVCARALTVANNVAIDVSECGGPPGAAVDIAHQIAAKVPKT
jgi:serine/threonine protein kinase